MLNSKYAASLGAKHADTSIAATMSWPLELLPFDLGAVGQPASREQSTATSTPHAEPAHSCTVVWYCSTLRLSTTIAAHTAAPCATRELFSGGASSASDSASAVAAAACPEGMPMPRLHGSA